MIRLCRRLGRDSVSALLTPPRTTLLPTVKRQTNIESNVSLTAVDVYGSIYGRRSLSTQSKSDDADTMKKPWSERMSDEDFELMADILHSPSPVNVESSMTNLLKRETQKFAPLTWKCHSFKSNAALVVDSDPNASGEREDYSGASKKKLTCMVVGHSDKIRLQVKSVGSDGKVYIASDSHLPLTLLGNEVSIFTQAKKLRKEEVSDFSKYQVIKGGTVEALGAIHFANPQLRSGTQGLKSEQCYVELQLHGDKKKEQVTDGLGIRTGDTILMQRRISRGVGKNSFSGSHLDNGLGCYVTFALSRLLAQDAKNPSATNSVFDSVRFLFTYCTHEEIGRFGSRQLVNLFKPDVLLAVDVNHDYTAAPGVGDKHFPDLEMGKGPTICIGSICSPYVNSVLQTVAEKKDIPLQLDVMGQDSGTDAMAGVLGNQDTAVASVGVPVRNMHTISECGVTDDVIGATHLIYEALHELSANYKASGLEMFHHPDLSVAEVIREVPDLPEKEEETETS